MAQFQQVYTQYPSPAVVVNTPTPMGYTYAAQPAMQSYYPSIQPGTATYMQPNGYYQGAPYVRRHHPCTECCLGLLCLGACTCCCAEECCCGGDDCCYGSGYYNADSCCGCC